jgi:hypothetical protein
VYTPAAHWRGKGPCAMTCVTANIATTTIAVVNTIVTEILFNIRSSFYPYRRSKQDLILFAAFCFKIYKQILNEINTPSHFSKVAGITILHDLSQISQGQNALLM